MQILSFLLVAILLSACGGGSNPGTGEPGEGCTETYPISAASTVAGDQFGAAISLAGNMAIVGAPNATPSTGNVSGAAYLFQRTKCEWTELAKISPSLGGWGTGVGSVFGSAAAVTDSLALVGAPNAAQGALGYAGAAYLFEKQADGTWAQALQITQVSPAASDQLGKAVALSGNVALVAMPNRNVNGANAGSVNVYEKSRGWANTAVLRPDAGIGPGSYFGTSVSISGDYVVVGAPGDAEAVASGGAAYVYEKQSDGSWLKVQKLTPWDAVANGRFGAAVAISGTVIIVGAPADDDKGAASGSAYVFERQASGGWVDVTKLTASDGAAQNHFGYSVATDGTRAAVGAYDSTQLPVGYVYHFERAARRSTWSQINKLTAPQTGTYFGSTVSVSGTTYAAGSPDKDSGVVGKGVLGPVTSSSPVAVAASCSAPATAQLHFVGVYEPSNLTTDEVKVWVTGSGNLILVLSAYEILNWNIINLGSANITKVIVNGNGDATVTGVSPAVVFEHTSNGTGSSYVGTFPYSYPSGSATTLINQAQADTGLGMASFHGFYYGTGFTVRGCAL